MPQSRKTLLFIDDDADIVRTADMLLSKAGYRFLAASAPAQAYALLTMQSVDLILLDLNFSSAQTSGEEGLACLQELRRHAPDAPVLVVTGHSGLTVAVRALRAGAANFIMKPWSNDKLIAAIDEAIEQGRQNTARTGADPVDAVTPDAGFIVGDSDAMNRIKALIDRYAPLNVPVLLSGPSGVGKSHIARALHARSGRSKLKIIDASAFGSLEADGLTDATLILESIDGLEAGAQQNLLSLLPEFEQRNVRVVATTTHVRGELDLPRSLIYALSTLEISVPPLSERASDIGVLAEHFANLCAYRHDLGRRDLTPEAIAHLKAANWRDNLHALRQVMERAVISVDGAMLGPDDLRLPDMADEDAPRAALNLEMTEKFVVESALKRHNFNVSKAAAELGITRQTLYRRMSRHGL